MIWKLITNVVVFSVLMQVPVEVFAQYCHKRVEKMAQSGAKKGVKKPAVEEIIHAKVMLTCVNIRLRVCWGAWLLPTNLKTFSYHHSSKHLMYLFHVTG